MKRHLLILCLALISFSAFAGKPDGSQAKAPVVAPDPTPIDFCGVSMTSAFVTQFISGVNLKGHIYYVFEDLDRKLKAAGVELALRNYLLDMLRRASYSEEEPPMAHRRAARLASKATIVVTQRDKEKRVIDNKTYYHPTDRFYLYDFESNYGVNPSSWEYTTPPDLPKYRLFRSARGKDNKSYIGGKLVLLEIIRLLKESNKGMAPATVQALEWSLHFLYNSIHHATDTYFRLWLLYALIGDRFFFDAFVRITNHGLEVDDAFYEYMTRSIDFFYLDYFIKHTLDRVKLPEDIEQVVYQGLVSDLGIRFTEYFRGSRGIHESQVFRLNHIYWGQLHDTVRAERMARHLD